MRLSKKERKALEILADTPDQWIYGLDIVKASGGVLRRGTVYVTLNRLEGRHLIYSVLLPRGDGVTARRQYWISHKGVQALEQAQAAAG